MSYLKRIFLFVLCTALLLSFSACGNTRSASSSSGSTADSTPKPTAEPVPTALPQSERNIDMANDVGVTIGTLTSFTEESAKLLVDSGVTYVRVHFMYPFNADGVSVSNSYTIAKRAAEIAHNAGLKVLAQSFWPGGQGYDANTGSVTWLSNLPNVYDGFDDAYFYKISKAAVKYMAEDLKEITNLWLVSNEPDINVYTGAMTVQQIAKYLNTCAEGIREGNPNAVCGVNMMGTVWKDYTELILKQLDLKSGVWDYLGLDGYFGTLMDGSPETWKDYIESYHELTGLPIVITEWSYSSAAADPLGSLPSSWEGHTRGNEAQADYVTECLKIFSEYDYVLGSFWYCLYDSDAVCWECGRADCKLYSSWGLLNADGSAKPSMDAMREAIQNNYK